jgi:hypothetical protein
MNLHLIVQVLCINLIATFAMPLTPETTQTATAPDTQLEVIKITPQDLYPDFIQELDIERCKQEIEEVFKNFLEQNEKIQQELDKMIKAFVDKTKAQESAESLSAELNNGIECLNHADAQSHQQALAHFNKVINTPNAQTINTAAWLKAQSCLGEMHLFGRGVTKNYPQALTHFNNVINPRHNAQTINLEAWLVVQCYLGAMYLIGDGVAQSSSQALIHFNNVIDPTHNAQMIATISWLDAQRYLGIMYYVGLGITENNQQAQIHFNAILNTPDAQTLNPMAFRQANYCFAEIKAKKPSWGL